MKQLTKKQVRETAAGKSISAYVILKKGIHIATVQSVFTDSGNVMVDVWDKSSLIHQGKAGGYGYDKFTSALAGAVIDGVKLFDHSQSSEDLRTHLARHQQHPTNDLIIKSVKDAEGARFANWSSDKGGGHYTSIYYESGLNRLKLLGYTVIQAI